MSFRRLWDELHPVPHEYIRSLKDPPCHKADNAWWSQAEAGELSQEAITPLSMKQDEVGRDQDGGRCFSSLHCDGHYCLMKFNFSKFL